MASEKEELRRRAERLIGEIPENELASAPESIQKLVNELRVHQIELEIQNEELRTAELEANESRRRFFELYDLATVAYLTINRQGVVRQANFAAGGLLGIQRGDVGSSLGAPRQ